MKKYISILLLVFMANCALAKNIDSLFLQANTCYNEAKYEEAVGIYDAILLEGKESSTLYYNLGNAYFKQNLLAKAILNYERAHKLNPNDDDIIHNLSIARSMLVDSFEDVPEFFLVTFFKNISNLFSVNTWSLLALVAFALTLVLVLLFLFASSLAVRRTSFWIACFVLLFSVSCKLIEWDLRKYDSAIVNIPLVTGKSSPDDSGKDVFILHEGTKVLVRDTYSDWIKIQIPNGEQAWVVGDAIEII